jgi:hypothetical protein
MRMKKCSIGQPIWKRLCAANKKQTWQHLDARKNSPLFSVKLCVSSAPLRVTAFRLHDFYFGNGFKVQFIVLAEYGLQRQLGHLKKGLQLFDSFQVKISQRSFLVG